MKHISPDLFDEIIKVLADNNGAFDASVTQTTINGVIFHRAPF